MIARLIATSNGQTQLLCADGSICNPTEAVLFKLLTNFEKADEIFGKDGVWNTITSEMSMVSGETLAVVINERQLIILDFTPFKTLLGYSDINYLSVQEYAQLHNKSIEIIKVFCRQNRIIGAQKIGKSWIIPEDAPYPVPPNEQREYNPLAGRKSKK